MQASTLPVRPSSTFSAGPVAAPVTTNTKLVWLSYALSALITAFLVFDGVIKLVPLEVVTQTMTELGYPAGLERTLGVITLACALLYAVPRTSVLGAILLTGLLGGAIATHLRVGSPLFSHLLFGVYLGLMAWGGLWLRDNRLRALLPFKL